MSIVIRNGIIITQNGRRQVMRGDVLVEGGRIAEVGTVRGSADEEIDARGGAIMPGLINTHTHVSMAVMKGLVDDLPFDDFLRKVFALDGRRKESDIAAGSRLGLLEMVRTGTTTFVELYYSLDIIAREVERAGIRGVLCWAILDEEHTTQKGNPIENCRRFISEFENHPLITPGVGPQGVYVCSDRILIEAKELASGRGVPLTLHLSETRREVYDYRRKVGRRPVEHLEEIGFLGPNCVAAHAAWLTINEVHALARTGASVSTCPVSNMKLATGGLPPIPEMLEAGVNVTVGTDGSSTNNCLDMFQEMKFLSLLHKFSRWDPTVLPAQSVLDMATINAAKAIGMGDLLGSIEVGKRADLIVLDGREASTAPLREDNAVSNIVYSATGANVSSTICDGKLLMRDRRLLTVEAEKIIGEAHEAASRLLSG
jgi:5-methylthioadenosine/S-adenosylhomocysteine deaminase